MGLKIPPYDIDTMFNTDPGFYPLMGPFLSQREVVAELGSPVWDDDDKRWLIAHAADEVFGFVAVKPAGPESAWVQSFYVVPDARREAIGAALMQNVVDLWPGLLRATATEGAVTLFTMYGFSVTGTRGSFTTMERHGADHALD